MFWSLTTPPPHFEPSARNEQMSALPRFEKAVDMAEAKNLNVQSAPLEMLSSLRSRESARRHR